MRSFLVRALPLVLLLGCSRKDPPPVVNAAPTAPIASASASVDAGGTLVVSESPSGLASVLFASAVVPSVVPKLPPQEAGMMDHMKWRGWALDSSFLGGCWSAAADGDICQYQSPTGAIETKWRKVTPNSSAWIYSDVEITWRVFEGDQEKKRVGVLEVGANVRGEPIAWVVKLSETKVGYHDRIHPEIIALSPDGKWVGVIAHAFAGEWANAFPTSILSVKTYASKAYLAAAEARTKKGDTAGASLYEKKAQAASP